MKRLFSLLTGFLLVVAGCAALVACGGDSSSSGEDPLTASSDTPREEPLRRRNRRVKTPAPAPDPAAVPAPELAQEPPPLTSPAIASSASAWRPALNSTWQLQLTGSLDTNRVVAIQDIDLFDTSEATIAALRGMGQRVICYFSAGSSENWRPDFPDFGAGDMGDALSGWPGERWLDTRSENVRQIMKQRLDLARSKGCDGVDPDNVDGYTNKSGLPLDASTQLDYNRFLAREAHARGLAIGLKNDVDQLAELEPDFDFAVNEQCFQYNECDGYSVFTSKGKPVLQVEYAAKYKDNTNGARDVLCAAAKAANLRTLVLSVQLDGSFRFSCD